MTQREAYFASKVAKMISDKASGPDNVRPGGLVRSYISPPYVKPDLPDVVQVGDAVTGVVVRLF